jgi:hypothetical protein
LYQAKWLVNPFALFRAGFGLGDQPIPDTTTASGNRLYLSVLDSEGWNRSSKIEDALDAPLTAGEVVLRDLIEPFADLPVSVDLPDKETAKSAREARQARRLRERLLAVSNVEPSVRRLRATLSRFDAEYPSISNLAPLISAGPDHLINMPMSDEAYYNKAGPMGENGFLALRETITNTEAPRRLKPFNLNYHAYAGEYPALLRSVVDRLRDAGQVSLTPVSADRYADRQRVLPHAHRSHRQHGLADQQSRRATDGPV